MADDSTRHRITVPDPEGWDDPVTGKISRADAIAYLDAQGWRRQGAWFLRGPEGEEDRIPVHKRISLPKLVEHIAMAEGRVPRSVLRDIEALAAETSPTTDRDPAPLFKKMRLTIPPDRGMMPFVASIGEIDGYRIVQAEREGTEAILTLRRIDPGEED